MIWEVLITWAKIEITLVLIAVHGEMAAVLPRVPVAKVVRR